MVHRMLGFTERLLCDAGVGAGMRVVDLGCGRGDVTQMLAELVGPEGEVVGVDRDGGVLAIARARAPRLRFEEGDFTSVAALGPFDVAVGRRVLMYQPDPVAAVKHLSEAVRPGGILVFQEHQAAPFSEAVFPLHAKVQGWIWAMVGREGAHLAMGTQLVSVLEQAGLVVENVRAEAVLQTRTFHSAFHASLATLARACAGRLIGTGVVTPEELDLDSLEERLSAERAASPETFIGDLAFGAWGHRPPACG